MSSSSASRSHVQDVVHLKAERIRTFVYAEEVQNDRDGLPRSYRARERALSLATANLLDALVCWSDHA